MLLELVTRLWRGLLLLWPLAALAGPAALRLEPDPDCARVRFLGWDTEGGPRANTNLLRAGTGMGLRIQTGGKWREGADFPTRRENAGRNATRYRLSVAPDAELVWYLERKGTSLVSRISGRGKGWPKVESVELVFPFDPIVTPTTALPTAWSEKGDLLLPAVISAPDYGQFLLAGKGAGEIRSRLEGSRARHTVDLIVALPRLRHSQTCGLSLTPVYLSAPKGLKDKSLWQASRRGWFGALQCTSKWGDAGNPFSAPAGMLANNVISDPASSALWFYADQAFWTPELAPGVSSMQLVRRTLDWWLDQKVLPSSVEYGLVPPEQGREILARLRRKIEDVGFTRFDLGVPPMLLPVRRGDYLLPDAIGCPQREDGRDTFGYYMNGAITAGQVLHFLAAHYVVGEPAPADRILRAMLERQARGEFQNGAVNAYPKGMDWTTWTGQPAGYEGYLADSFRFLQAVLLRESAFRARLYRPLTTSRPQPESGGGL